MTHACVRVRMGVALRCTRFRVLSSSFPPPGTFLHLLLHVPCPALPYPIRLLLLLLRFLWDVVSLHYKERFVALLVRLLVLVLVALALVLVLGF